MPFGNFTELQDAIRDYLVQFDIEGKVQDFITLAEARFNREIRHYKMQAFAKYNVMERFIPYPAWYIEAINWRVTSLTPEVTLQYIPPNRFYATPGLNVLGAPRAYTIATETENSLRGILLGPDPGDIESGEDHVYEVRLEYYGKISPLTNTNSSNWLLEDAPDLYLYGSLLEAEPFVANDARMATWEKLYERGRNSLNAVDARSRYRPGGVMRPDGSTSDGKAWRY